MDYHLKCYLPFLHKALGTHKIVPTQSGKQSKKKQQKDKKSNN